MSDKETKSVDEAIEEVAEHEDSAELGKVREALGKAHEAMERASTTIHDAYGKARDRSVQAADKARVYLDDARRHLGEARDSMGALASRTREQAEVLYAKAKEQYEALLDGLSELLSGQPDSVIVDHAAIVQSFRAFDASADLVRAYVITSLALGIEPSDRPERTRQMQAAFVARVPNLNPEEVRVTFSTLRVLVSSRAWHLLRQLGVDGERGGAEVARVFDLVVADLERRNAAACKE